MEGLFRRTSGVYVARLAVPPRHRGVLGKTEFIASTGSRELAVARIVAGELVASWRRRIIDLDRLSAGMDVLKLTAGSPALLAGGHISLPQAFELSGVDPDVFLREAADGKLPLFVLVPQLDGFELNESDCDLDVNAGSKSLIVPTASQMPDHAIRRTYTGILRLREPVLCANALLANEPPVVVLFDLVPPADGVFAPVKAMRIESSSVVLAVPDVERVRAALSARVTGTQLSAARSRADAVAPVRNPYNARRMSEVVPLFMKDRATKCQADQARRVKAACDLFVELMDDPAVGDVDRALLREYRDKRLPSVPAGENAVRLKFGTTSVASSIAAIAGTDHARISADEATKRMRWLCEMFRWMKQEGWTHVDLAEGLASASEATRMQRNRTKKKRQDHRDAFTADELHRIFSEPWYAQGRGELTRTGTYREFMPSYYWLPLMGLFTGARINEIAQLSLADIKQSDNGVWFVEFTEESDETDPTVNKKKLKNLNSVRKVPLHSTLLHLGLVAWRDELRSARYSRLFPELKYDLIKGYGKSATKWFSRMLAGYGWPRDGRKVFHSFRHTLASECLNSIGLSESETAQISGHRRGGSVLTEVYRKDVPFALQEAVNRLAFRLPPIAPFDVPAGVKAVRDALARKDRGRGAVPD